jgi:ABC-2 type transport system ATP-binding protein
MKQENNIIVSVKDLSRHYGAKAALDRVTLEIPRGVVFGLVGANGAGKTTLLRHLLGLLKPQSGTVRIFGLDPVADPEATLSRMGFLSEDRDLPLWMKVKEMMAYQRAFFPAWDPDYAESLRQQFGLESTARLKTLSRGELAKMGLLLALAHRPELLVLDEPSSGLDPLVRRDILEAIVRTIAEEGRSVIFSSHLLDEIERVSDHVGFMSGGTLALSGEWTTLQEAHWRVVISLDTPALSAAEVPQLPGARRVTGRGREWAIIGSGPCPTAPPAGARIVETAGARFEDVFLAYVSPAGTAGAPTAVNGFVAA